MTIANQLPDFSVIVWVRLNESFDELRSELLAIAPVEPYQMFQYQGMVDFHWGFDDISDAQDLAAAFGDLVDRPEIAVLHILSNVDAIESISIKDDLGISPQ